MKRHGPDLSALVPVDVDNTGEPYICAVPLVWVRLPGSTGKLSEPQWTTREHFAEMHRNWEKAHRPRLKSSELPAEKVETER